jgi:hypothetical protein
LEIKIRTMREDELSEIKDTYKLGNRLVREEAEKLIKDMKADDLLEEFSPEGLGNIFFEQLKNGSSIFTDELIKWIHTEQKGTSFIAELSNIFRNPEIIEHHNNSFKLKVQKLDYSIGYVFGFMEGVKNIYEISEYSVSSTSLEQIFNNFAREGEGVIKF